MAEEYFMFQYILFVTYFFVCIQSPKHRVFLMDICQPENYDHEYDPNGNRHGYF